MRLLLIYLIFFTLLVYGCTEKEKITPEPPGKIIILMYHRLTTGEAGNTYERSVTDFREDMEYLKRNNINVIDFNDLEEISVSGKMPPGNSAIITFDDGDHSWYTQAKPLLLEFKYRATFFLWTYKIGQNSFLSWQEIEDMSYYTLPGGINPFKFGSHTFSHPYLYASRTSFSSETEYNSFLDYELRESKAIIDLHSPVPVSVLALPYGDGAGDEDIKAAALRNGYKFIRTSVHAAIENADMDLLVLPSLPMLDVTNSDEIGYFLNQ